jgi:hypothetical protein
MINSFLQLNDSSENPFCALSAKSFGKQKDWKE